MKKKLCYSVKNESLFSKNWIFKMFRVLSSAGNPGYHWIIGLKIKSYYQTLPSWWKCEKFSSFSNPVQYLPIHPVHTLKLSAAEELKLCSISSSMKNASREMISADVFSDLKVFSSSFLVLQERIWPCNVKMKRRRQFLFSSRPIWGKRWGRVHWHQRFISYPSVFSSFTNRDDITISFSIKKKNLLPGCES